MTNQLQRIRCNNCMTIWNNEDELPVITIIRKGKEDEIVKGCSCCGTDSCIMDI